MGLQPGSVFDFKTLDASSGYTPFHLTALKNQPQRPKNLWVFILRRVQRAWGCRLGSFRHLHTSSTPTASIVPSLYTIGFWVRFCLKKECHCLFFFFLRLETTDKPLSFGSQERKLRPRGGKGLRSLCKSGPKLGLEPDPGGPAWRPGPSWEAAHWVCQGLRPAPLGAAQEGPSAFSVSPPPPPCLTPVWITFSPVPSQALPEVWLPPLLVPGNPGALAVWQPRPGWSHADSC